MSEKNQKNQDIRKWVESLLTAQGIGVKECGYGFWLLTTDKSRMVASLRVKASATFHRLTQAWEYGVDPQDWHRLQAARGTPIIMIYDKQDGTLAYAPVKGMKVRTYESPKIEPTIFVRKDALKIIRTPQIATD